MSHPSERHISNTKFANLLTVSSYIIHAVIVIEDAWEHTLYKSSTTNYELYEGNSPSKFYVTHLQHGIDEYVATLS